MGLKEYDVVDPQSGRETTLQLSDEDAARMGLTKAGGAAKAKEPENKSRTPSNKQAPKKATKGDG